jgi:hypothetical protein
MKVAYDMQGLLKKFLSNNKLDGYDDVRGIGPSRI